jgi:hypothetical protein
MAKVVLLSCTKSKLSHKAPAQELYSASPMFQKTLEYGKSLDPDKMFILSAKHHLVPLDKVLEPYDKTLKDMPGDEKEKWGEITVKQMVNNGIDLKKDKFIFLTGNEYSKPLTKYIPLSNISMPMAGKRLGERLKWLNTQINKINEFINRAKKIIYECFSKTK